MERKTLLNVVPSSMLTLNKIKNKLNYIKQNNK